MKTKRNLTFGDHIRQQRLDLDIGLRKLAQRIGISATYLSKIERNELEPPAEERIMDLARALDLNADDLMALAKRLPPDVRAYIEDHPDEVTVLIRLVRDVGRERLRERLSRLADRTSPSKRRA